MKKRKMSRIARRMKRDRPIRWWGLTQRFSLLALPGGGPTLPVLTAHGPDKERWDAAIQRNLSNLLSHGALWTDDNKRAPFDTMTHPRVVYQRILDGESPGDCDDHASFRAACMLKVRRAGEPLYDRVWLGLVHFLERDGARNGHVVVVYQVDGVVYWIDYNKRHHVINTDGTQKPRGWADDYCASINATLLGAKMVGVELGSHEMLIQKRK